MFKRLKVNDDGSIASLSGTYTKEQYKDKKWILYITIPLLLMVLAMCITMIINMNHPFSIGFTMDNNTLEAVKLVNSDIISNSSMAIPNTSLVCTEPLFLNDGGYYCDIDKIVRS